MRDFIDRLLNLDAAPIVTITLGLDPRLPGNEVDRIRLRNALAEAAARLSAMADHPGASRTLDRLNEVADVELRGGNNGLIVVASPNFSAARLLPFPVRDELTVGDTPLIRYLVQGLRRSPRYLILVISDRATRLFDADRDSAREIVDDTFPMSADIVPRDRRATSGRFALPPGGDDKELWRNFYRDVDAAVVERNRDDERPLVLAGVRSSIGLFREVSRNGRLVVDSVEGSYDELSANVLATMVWPHMREELERLRAEAVHEVAGAAATNAAVTGLDEVWRLAQAKRGRLLVVEEGYRAEPSIETAGHLEPAADHHDQVIEDPVNQVVIDVVRGGGDVEFVPDDALAGLGRIGLLLR